ncbi:MAG: two-component system LytT family response regulator [Crocinitomix sp.]|jgi:two-component system LytT family response regulator
MNIVIVDSNQNHGAQLKTLLHSQKRKSDQILVADSVKWGYDLFKDDPADLVFLDINLCEGTSFRLLRKYKEQNFNVVFIIDDTRTSQIFNDNKLDFILKPYDKDALEGIYAKMRAKITADIFGDSNLGETKRSEARLSVKVKDGIRFVEISAIVRCESDNNYTEIHLENGEKILSSKTLKEHSKILQPYGFYRVHQSHLVDVGRITKILSKDGLFVQLQSGHLVELSRRRKDNLLRSFRLNAN